MKIKILNNISYAFDENGVDFPAELIAEIGRTKQFLNGQIVEYKTPMYKKQMQELKDWFEQVYTYKEQKYRRLITLNKKCDDGTSPNDKILALYNEAETKRKRIQELEVMLNE